MRDRESNVQKMHDADREKLIALPENASYQFDNRDCGEDAEGCEYHCYPNCWAQFIADHLIANGVTIQRWIPVEERLPKHDGCYIVTACDEGVPYGEGIWYDTVVVLADYYDDGRWVWYEGSTEYDLCDIVTHWMPLPESPIKEQNRAREGENDG